MKKILNFLSSVFVLLLSSAWIVAMSVLFKYNWENTGLWFALGMILLGLAVFITNIFHTFGLRNKIKNKWKK